MERLVALRKPLLGSRQLERSTRVDSDLVCSRSSKTRLRKWTSSWEKGNVHMVCAAVEEIVVLCPEEVCTADKWQSQKKKTPVLQIVPTNFLLSGVQVVPVNNNNSSLVLIRKINLLNP